MARFTAEEEAIYEKVRQAKESDALAQALSRDEYRGLELDEAERARILKEYGKRYGDMGEAIRKTIERRYVVEVCYRAYESATVYASNESQALDAARKRMEDAHEGRAISARVTMSGAEGQDGEPVYFDGQERPHDAVIGHLDGPEAESPRHFLRRMLEDSGKSQRELASALCVQPASVSYVLNHKEGGSLTFGKLLEWAEALGYSVTISATRKQ